MKSPTSAKTWQRECMYLAHKLSVTPYLLRLMLGRWVEVEALPNVLDYKAERMLQLSWICICTYIPRYAPFSLIPIACGHGGPTKR